jgi:hypothetical protein
MPVKRAVENAMTQPTLDNPRRHRESCEIEYEFCLVSCQMFYIPVDLRFNREKTLGKKPRKTVTFNSPAGCMIRKLFSPDINTKELFVTSPKLLDYNNEYVEICYPLSLRAMYSASKQSSKPVQK